MNPRVLVVDDSLTVRMDLDEALRGIGFETALSTSLADARRHLAEEEFALAILDVILPDGNGIDLLREIRTSPRTERLPVMLLSTEAEVRDRIRGLKTGADEYVGKPYDRAYLLARAGQLANRARAAPSTVLVIDDSTTYRQELKKGLEGAGFAVAIASNGEEGLAQAVTLRPTAIIVDGVMPGLHGADVVRRVRQDSRLRRTPCLLLTGSDDPGGELRALEAGADAYVRKDLDAQIVLVRLAALLRRGSAEHAANEPAGFLGPKRILAVDDSMTYLQELAGQLREEGYDVATARSGEEAIELLAVQPPDCVLLDLMMPGLSGHETCRLIKSAPQWRDIPLMILTALDEREAMIEGINAGADDYIPKSSEFSVLKARLRAQLRRRQFEDENRRIREELLRKEVEATEARASRQLAETRAQLLAELEQRNRDLESFSYSVSHDLRAPLRAIDGFCKILEIEHGPKLDEDARRCIRIARENASKMSQLIDDLLEFSRLGRQAMRPAPLDVAAMARAVGDELHAQAPGRNIKIEIGPMPHAVADPALVRQLLINLISNAIKYTGPRETAVIQMSAIAGDREITYSIKDNGVGFNMQHAGKLFGVFQRLHSSDEFEGTGVGLALVQRIVQRHAGRIWAEAKVDEGATFFFTLPAKQPA
jgi:DNA-binding response OmpR family regulator